MRNYFTNEELLHAHVEWTGEHKGLKYLISCVLREPSSYMGYDKAWCTYVLLTPEQHKKYNLKLNDAPWNCGQTYYRKHSVEHIDVHPELKAKWDGHWYKMGDDFQHLWDDGRHDLYSLRYMHDHIKGVINYIVGETKANEGGGD
jgi:hypothetical protein